MTLCSCVSPIRPPSRGADLEAVERVDVLERRQRDRESQTFDHGSGEAAKKAIDSRPKILSPIGLSRRLPLGRQIAWPSCW